KRRNGRQHRTLPWISGRRTGGRAGEGTAMNGSGAGRTRPAIHVPDEPPLLELRDFTVSFLGHPVVVGLNLAIRRGEAVGIVGESGSGKSVTWLAALGLLSGSPAVRGEALLDREDLIGASEERLSQVR